ncbi:targeting protein for Xklp2 homolog isoform X2 [Diaphorina citri]|uniref:Targeting protein for Xklp2 homolog isoform X2 n=1 Tax=Diaphorina citri TaxID=121845 RepID=A0A3Q0JH41_DIACI|nr:targeting protein for Xklp2 homolog isoform X2 [Diaphorina citri]
MSETQKFEYNAPTYVDFVNGFDDSGDVDNFFDLSKKQESEGGNMNSTMTMNSQLCVPKVEEEFCTPDKHSTPEPAKHNSPDPVEDYIQQENLTPNVKATCKTPNPQNGRRSRILFEALEGLCITGSLKTHKMMTRKDPRTPLLELRGRTVPRNVNFTFDHDKIQNKVCREIIFEDETDNLAKQIGKMSFDNAIAHETEFIDNKDMLQGNQNTTVTYETEQVNQHNVTFDNQETTVIYDAKQVNKNDIINGNKENGPRNGTPLKCIENNAIGEQRKRKSCVHSPTVSSMHNNKYISLAETALKSNGGFKPRQENKYAPKETTKFLTKPKTPNLQTKSRVRPSNILSHSQEEEKIMKELRAHQPKALPIPKGLFNPPKLGVRRVAVPKYNFSNNDPKKKIEFLPRKGVGHSKDNCVKVVETDQDGMTVINKEVGHRGVGVSIAADTATKYKNRVTKCQPFSFYEREQERFRKKEEKIKEIIEEEKRWAEFHANPLPRFVQKAKKQLASSQGSLNMTTCSHSTTCSINSEQFVFKAKSPSVLHQKPFIPRKSIKPCSQVLDFTLHTEERSHQRELYESTKKQRELEMQLYLQEREREQREREEAEYRKARMSTVHKPLPLPKYK